MGGRTSTTSNTNTSQNQTSTATMPGTGFGTDVLGQIQSSGIVGDVFASGQDSYSGDRVATANQPSNGFVPQWGAAPDTFVAGRTTTDAPTQVDQTYVDRNYQPGIAEGLDVAASQRDQLRGISDAGLDRWGQIIGGQQNPQLDAMLARLQQEHAEGAQVSANALQSGFGQAGAYGGSNMGRESAWMAEQQQQELDAATANLLWEDYYNNQQMLLQAPSAVSGMAAVGDITGQRMLEYGGLGLENDAWAAAIADENAQRAANNAWQTGTLADTNSQIAADEAIAQWNAAHQIAGAQTAEGVAQSQFNQANAQAGLDNDFYSWLSQNETMNEMLNRLQSLVNIGASVPGGTQTSQGTGQSSTTSTTQQSSDPWSIMGGLLGAGMQAFGSGMFGQLGGIGQLGGTSQLPQVPQVPTVPQLPYPWG